MVAILIFVGMIKLVVIIKNITGDGSKWITAVLMSSHEDISDVVDLFHVVA